MTPGRTPDLSDDQLADLARLADGTLPPDRRAEVEAAVAASPELASAFEQQAFAMQALRTTTDIGAPARLRGEIERRQAGRAKRRRSFSPRAILATGVAATLAIVLALPPLLAGGLSVQAAAAYAEKPPTEGAPAGVPGTPQLLRKAVDGVPFPNYAAKFGWKPVGARHDSGHDRKATTVYYEKNGRQMAYTIVSGKALGEPSKARVTERGAKDFRIFRNHERTVVTWERDGHTCVLSADRVPAAELVALADWRGKGAI